VETRLAGLLTTQQLDQPTQAWRNGVRLLQGIHSQFQEGVRHLSQRVGVWWAPLLLLYGLFSLFIALNVSRFIRLESDDYIINSPIPRPIHAALTGIFLFQQLISSLCIVFGFLDNFFRIW